MGAVHDNITVVGEVEETIKFNGAAGGLLVGVEVEVFVTEAVVPVAVFDQAEVLPAISKADTL